MPCLDSFLVVFEADLEVYRSHFRIGGAILSNELEDLALSLSFLNRLGLYPVILHGAGPQLNEILEREGVVPDYEDGIRITGESTRLGVDA
jgi:acetylglutamate kinase